MTTFDGRTIHDIRFPIQTRLKLAGKELRYLVYTQVNDLSRCSGRLTYALEQVREIQQSLMYDINENFRLWFRVMSNSTKDDIIHWQRGYGSYRHSIRLMNRCTTIIDITYEVLRNDKLLMIAVRYFREP
jgi:hypothetical protein